MALTRNPVVEGKATDDERKQRYLTELKKELAGHELYGRDDRAAMVRKEIARATGKEKPATKAPETTSAKPEK